MKVGFIDDQVKFNNCLRILSHKCSNINDRCTVPLVQTFRGLSANLFNNLFNNKFGCTVSVLDIFSRFIELRHLPLIRIAFHRERSDNCCYIIIILFPVYFPVIELLITFNFFLFLAQSLKWACSKASRGCFLMHSNTLQYTNRMVSNAAGAQTGFECQK